METWSPELHAAMTHTWQLAFDLPRRGCIQATIATLHATDVLSAVRPQPVPPRSRGDRRRRGRTWDDDTFGTSP